MTGTLYIVATPIGNLEDITLRASRILKEANLILCEDTRHSKKLLSHIGSDSPLASFHDHNERGKTEGIVKKLLSGMNIALISDAGTPTISDPGFVLIRECRKSDINVIPIPGASASITALSASGLPADRFVFYGFPPEKQGKRLATFKEAANQPMTCIFYLSPHKVAKQLKDAASVFGKRPAALMRELTKLHEEHIKSDVEELASYANEQKIKGELVLLIEGKKEEIASEEEIHEVAEQLFKQGIDGRSLTEELIGRFGINKKMAYNISLELKKDYGLIGEHTMSDFTPKRILILTAHADDCEFFAGGTVAKFIEQGAEVTEVIATDNSRGSFDMDSTELVRESREIEAKRAAKIMGKTEVAFLEYPDGFLDETPKNELRRIYMKWIRRVQPDLLMTFDPFASFETHPDHIHVARAAVEAVGFAHMPLYHSEQIKAGLAPHMTRACYYFAKHNELANHVEDISSTIDKKIQALNVQTSQMRLTVEDIRRSLELTGKHPEILPLLDVDTYEPAIDIFIKTWAGAVGKEAGFDYGEAFRTEEVGNLFDSVTSGE